MDDILFSDGMKTLYMEESAFNFTATKQHFPGGSPKSNNDRLNLCQNVTNVGII
jgi:hypothetical protein